MKQELYILFMTKGKNIVKNKSENLQVTKENSEKGFMTKV